ncbi:chaperone modulator CbpM [Variovorax sp. J22R133]|uniref:chaperone modulator CbpM n=1 Tax=Variovorax brevis TaxID=3053503 RepID=UPI002578F46A|nr:chaperone modulator CbpM [Variovorax sp. J22R133]MDM0112775.1 chaperone modulator CbpM [Variovorax sp. J22R133]
MATVSVSRFTATAVSESDPIAASELAHACGAGIDWVVQLVEVGIVEVRASDRPPQDWRFESDALQCALEARRLERDFGVGLDAAALIIDLEREVRRLKAVLQARGIRAA